MIIRNAELVEYTQHGHYRAKERNIGYVEVKNAIEDGTVEETDERVNLRGGSKFEREINEAIEEGAMDEGDIPRILKYRLELPVDLIVVLDPVRRKIVTVYHDDEQGATGGKL